MLRAIVGIEIELDGADRQVEGEPEPRRPPIARASSPGCERRRRDDAAAMARAGARTPGRPRLTRRARAPSLAPRVALRADDAVAAPARRRRSRTRSRSACSPAPAATARRAAPRRDGYYPRIAGKPAGYLYNQLLNFRDGRRHYALMTNLLAPLDDAYLREIAAHFAGLDLPYPPPQPRGRRRPTLAARRSAGAAGRRRRARSRPACNCHGEALTGVAPAIPGLLGLPRDYLNAQLGAWRSGKRRAQAPDCMAQVAQRLAPEDIGAVSAWLAAQPVPRRRKPAAALPAPLPLACGGVRREPRRSAAQGDAAALASARRRAAASSRPCAGGRACLRSTCATRRRPRAPAPPTRAARRADRARRVPRARRQLHRLPHRARRRALRRRARHRDAVRHRLRAEPDARRRRPASAHGRPTSSGARCTTAARATAACCTRRSRIRTTRASRAPTPTRCSPTCAACRRWRSRTRRTRCAFRSTRRPRWRSGARCTSGPARYEPTRRASAEWNRGAYLVEGLGHCNACHVERATCSARRAARSTSAAA